MKSCRFVRKLMPRAVDGELGPGQSLELAQHLAGCSACRILMARQRRLLELLDRFEDTLPVDAGFARAVMASLPDEPPRAIRDRRRGLHLVGLVGLVALTLAWLSRLAVSLPGGGASPGLPRFSPEGLAPLLELLGGVVQMLLLVVSRAGAGAPMGLPEWSLGAWAGQMILVTAVAGAVALSTAVGWLARRYARGGTSRSALMRWASVLGETPSRLAAASMSPRSSVSVRRT